MKITVDVPDRVAELALAGFKRIGAPVLLNPAGQPTQEEKGLEGYLKDYLVNQAISEGATQGQEEVRKLITEES